MKRIIRNDDDDNINEIMETIINIVKDYDNYNLVKDKLNIIFKSIKDNIKEIRVYDNNLYIILYGAYFGVNYDFKNFPLVNFYCQSLKFNIYDCGIIIDEYSDFGLNLHELNLKNFEKIN